MKQHYFFKVKRLIYYIEQYANSVNKAPADFAQEDIFNIVFTVFTSADLRPYYTSQGAAEKAIRYLLAMDTAVSTPPPNT